MIFFIHNVYQSLLSKRTDLSEEHKAWIAPDYFQTSTKYAILASQGTMLTGAQLTSASENISKEIPDWSRKEVKAAIVTFFTKIPVVPDVTQVHYLLNYCRTAEKKLTDIPEDDFYLSMNAVKEKYKH